MSSKAQVASAYDGASRAAEAHAMATTSICLASTPARAFGNNVQHVIDTLLNQQPPPAHIVLTVPTAIARPNQPTLRLPDSAFSFAQREPYSSKVRLRLIEPRDDLGPAMKLLGCLQTLGSAAAGSCIAVTDDDAPRPPHWSRALCARLNTHRTAAVVGGVRSGNDMSLHVQGNRGFAIRRDAIRSTTDLERFVRHHQRSCAHTDDQLFTAYFRTHNMTILATPSSDSSLLLGGRYIEGNHHLVNGSGLRHRAALSGRAAVRRCYRSALPASTRREKSLIVPEEIDEEYTSDSALWRRWRAPTLLALVGSGMLIHGLLLQPPPRAQKPLVGACATSGGRDAIYFVVRRAALIACGLLFVLIACALLFARFVRAVDQQMRAAADDADDGGGGGGRRLMQAMLLLSSCTTRASAAAAPSPPPSGYALCLSGSLRSFNSVRSNLFTALIAPNDGIDMFVHVYHDPSRADHKSALAWLQGERMRLHVKGLVSEVWNITLEAMVIRHVGRGTYDRMRSEDLYGAKVGKPPSAMLSMWRKVYLCNEMRRAYEITRGMEYIGVVRARPDLAYGTPIVMNALSFKSGDGEDHPVIYTPVPPERGASWRMCEQSWLPSHLAYERTNLSQRLAHRPTGGGRCGAMRSESRPLLCKGQGRNCAKRAIEHECIDTPLMDSIGQLVECPCCERNLSALPSIRAIGSSVPTCGCPSLFAQHYVGGGRQNPHAFAREDLAQAVRERALGLPKRGWSPWSGYYVLDQFAIGHPLALDVYSSVYEHIKDMFLERPKMFHMGFLPERLVGSRLREEAARRVVKVRVIDTLQWGVRREVEEREYGRHEWLPRTEARRFVALALRAGARCARPLGRRTPARHAPSREHGLPSIRHVETDSGKCGCAFKVARRS